MEFQQAANRADSREGHPSFKKTMASIATGAGVLLVANVYVVGREYDAGDILAGVTGEAVSCSADRTRRFTDNKLKHRNMVPAGNVPNTSARELKFECKPGFMPTRHRTLTKDGLAEFDCVGDPLKPGTGKWKAKNLQTDVLECKEECKGMSEKKKFVWDYFRLVPVGNISKHFFEWDEVKFKCPSDRRPTRGGYMVYTCMQRFGGEMRWRKEERSGSKMIRSEDLECQVPVAVEWLQVNLKVNAMANVTVRMDLLEGVSSCPGNEQGEVPPLKEWKFLCNQISSDGHCVKRFGRQTSSPNSNEMPAVTVLEKQALQVSSYRLSETNGSELIRHDCFTYEDIQKSNAQYILGRLPDLNRKNDLKHFKGTSSVYLGETFQALKFESLVWTGRADVANRTTDIQFHATRSGCKSLRESKGQRIERSLGWIETWGQALDIAEDLPGDDAVHMRFPIDWDGDRPVGNPDHTRAVTALFRNNEKEGKGRLLIRSGEDLMVDLRCSGCGVYRQTETYARGCLTKEELSTFDDTRLPFDIQTKDADGNDGPTVTLQN